MVNVNVSKEGWSFVKGQATPGESFAQTFDRLLKEVAVMKDLIAALDEKAISDIQSVLNVDEEKEIP